MSIKGIRKIQRAKYGILLNLGIAQNFPFDCDLQSTV